MSGQKTRSEGPDTPGQTKTREFWAAIRRGAKVIWGRNRRTGQRRNPEDLPGEDVPLNRKEQEHGDREIHLNDFLEKTISKVETDLGEYIQQLDGEPPYHIVTPAMHKSKEDVTPVYRQTGDTAQPDSEQLTLVARINSARNISKPRSVLPVRISLSRHPAPLLSPRNEAMPG